MILLYHNITEDQSGRSDYSLPGLPLSCFTRQVDWLRRHRRVVPLSDYLKLTHFGRASAENLVAITFDDGLATTFERAYPVLKDLQAPATFFVSTSHLDGGQVLWFSYLNALCFDGSYAQVEVQGKKFLLASADQRKRSRRQLGAIARSVGDPTEFISALASVYPLPESSLREYAGMTSQQLAQFRTDDLIQCGAHTVNHLYLDKLSPEKQYNEINQSKRQLEQLTGKSVDHFAYPNGDYNQSTLEVLQSLGFNAAFATEQPRVGLKRRYEIVRMGIYSTSFARFWLKASGLVKPDLKRTIKNLWTVPNNLMPNRALPQK
jgi:peptidoglycan/xylan/chitin deacetylase (PgdA/CDA1 family)